MEAAMACTCGRPGSFASCCGPLLEGRRAAATAEELMRSRYSAYATGAIDYIHDTLAPEARVGFDRDASARWSREAEWLGLEIRRTEAGGPDDQRGIVEFVARYRLDHKDVDHHEVATFRKEEGRWFFADGEPPKQQPFRRAEPKVGPNEPCPCGSGKKLKKCCGRR
jgi:SEC-C motif-containing protein